jgi:hypothetical protein
MANYGELVIPQSRSNPRHVSREQANIVIGDGRWAATAAIAALIGYGDTKSGFHQRIDLMTPEIPALWPPMQQDDERPFTFYDRA